MATLEDREKEFETRFMHDHDLRFKVTARRNRLAGLWAAEKMGISGAAAEDYAKTVVAAELGKDGDKHVIDKLVADLAAKGHTVTPAQVRFELDHFAQRAKRQVMSE